VSAILLLRKKKDAPVRGVNVVTISKKVKRKLYRDIVKGENEKHRTNTKSASQPTIIRF